MRYFCLVKNIDDMAKNEHVAGEQKVFLSDDNIKNNIARIRALKNYTQEEMARRLEISRNTYRAIESGETRMVHHSLKDIARILNIKEDDLLFRPYDPGVMLMSKEHLVVHYEGLLEDQRQKLRDQMEMTRLTKSFCRQAVLVVLSATLMSDEDKDAVMKNVETLTLAEKPKDFSSAIRKLRRSVDGAAGEGGRRQPLVIDDTGADKL